MEKYRIEGKLGEGAHGLVLRGVELVSLREVALKKVQLKKLEDGIPKAVFREIQALKKIQCENVISLIDVFAHGLCFVLVFEYMPTGLWEMINDTENPLSKAQVKTYSKMLLRGVEHLHQHSIMHRDLKPANLLISKGGVLKIADLGLGRIFQNNNTRPFSHQVATRWYRAPELLYGARFYTPAVDMWAVGCIIGEMLNFSPLFPGETDIEQLVIVLRTLGTPTEKIWPGMTALPDYDKVHFSDTKGVAWNKIIPDAAVEEVDIVKSLLTYCPDWRLTANQALAHPFFFVDPLPCSMEKMPKPQDGHRLKFDAKTLVYDVDTTGDDMFKNLDDKFSKYCLSD